MKNAFALGVLGVLAVQSGCSSTGGTPGAGDGTGAGGGAGGAGGSTAGSGGSTAGSGGSTAGSGGSTSGSGGAGGAQVQPGCAKDVDCNGGKPGAGVICVASQCVSGCHADGDCPMGDTCDVKAAQCAAAPPPPVCPVLTYPSGIQIQTAEDAATTASYQGHLTAGQSAPKCFLDTDNLHDPSANKTYDLTVQVSTNFQLSELVGTEVNQGYGHFVLMSPAAVAALQQFRVLVGGPVSVNSGFRSPKHQEATCVSICGNPLGCPGTCSNNSRHMWGDAFDLPLQFYNVADTNLACDAGFKFTYLESGTHLHIDQNPAYAQCVQQ